jgi:NAD(P)-dependent dehydrogenase (short-subunit alcohol dehydrogenase family)
VSGTLAGRRAVVTGGTRGIGAAVAERLARDGAEVAALGRADADLADRAAAEALAARLASERVDVLVNCAGINAIAPFAEIDPADFDRIHEVNLRAPMLLCRAVVGGMRERGWGRIVNIGSIWGVVSRARRASYSASKFGLDGLTAALAAEVAADGVLANCVSPGVVETEMTRSVLGESGMAELVAQVPAGRLAQPAEVAELVAWLAGPANTFVSGQNVVIDGGFSRT